MPVVTLCCLAPDDPDDIDAALRAIVAAVAEAIGGDQSGTWAHWTPMAAVVQGERTLGFAAHCPIVTIRGRDRSDPSAVPGALRAAAAAVSAALSVPLEDVWVQWVEVEPGRAFAGGDVI